MGQFVVENVNDEKPPGFIFSATSPASANMPRTYYFDMKDGKAIRDRIGLEFQSVSAAIEHSKDLARRLRDDPRVTDPSLFVVVFDQDGREVHREPVRPGRQDGGPPPLQSR